MPFFCNGNLSQNLTATAFLTAEFNVPLSSKSHPRLMLKALQNARLQGSTIPVPRYKSNNWQGWSALGLQGRGGSSENGLCSPVDDFPYSSHTATQVGPLGAAGTTSAWPAVPAKATTTKQSYGVCVGQSIHLLIWSGKVQIYHTSQRKMHWNPQHE